ncbi:hypothetical protein MF271_19530 (plasmid) [Deinococcus sp. KNUC1210]|uniref:hypothetical protein n=1 Tax=Deinococcus sp. KNUC1210 TaxID=2917691 RepID=UPI001EF08C7C|nr:hypothetical protein [Deinococcus sp. KNUC1210]ULH17384.1 hypothetical protein MF271_19530 [Deinococcus sp. KNUC1210]
MSSTSSMFERVRAQQHRPADRQPPSPQDPPRALSPALEMAHLDPEFKRLTPAQLDAARRFVRDGGLTWRQALDGVKTGRPFVRFVVQPLPPVKATHGKKTSRRERRNRR